MLFYQDSMLLFYIGLLILSIGFGAVKGNIIPLLGDLYARNWILKDEAFSLYYMAINVGAFLGAFVIAGTFETYGFISMIIVSLFFLFIYLFIFFFYKKHIATIEKQHTIKEKIVRKEVVSFKWNLVLLFLTILVITSFWLAFEFGSSIWFSFKNNIQKHTETVSVLGMDLSIDAITTNLNFVFILLLGIPIIHYWTLRAARNKTVSPFYKFGFGIFFLAISYVVIYYAMKPYNFEIDSFNSSSIAFLLILVFAIQAFAEMFIAPIGLSFVDSLASRKYRSTTMGIYFASIPLFQKYFFQFTNELDSTEALINLLINISFYLFITAFLILLFKEELREIIRKLLYRN